jgi:hypothetical protein
VLSREIAKLLHWDESLQGGQEWLYHILVAIHIPDEDFCFVDEHLLFIRSSNTSITRNAPQTLRFENYLNARILLLHYLYAEHPDLFERFYGTTFRITMKYVKYLISANRFAFVLRYSKLICKVSILQCSLYNLGIVVYWMFKKTYFLNQALKITS